MVEDFFDGIKISPNLFSRGGFIKVQSKEIPGVKKLRQVHGGVGCYVDSSTENLRQGDWQWTREKNLRLGVFVADCTALLVAGESNGSPFVAAIHAGWRGTAAKIIELALEEINPAAGFSVWMSPSICQDHFEVGEEVIRAIGSEAEKFSRAGDHGKFFLDLKALQRSRLKNFKAIVKESSLCTFCQPDFFSYRRAKGNLDRRHLAWIELT